MKISRRLIQRLFSIVEVFFGTTTDKFSFQTIRLLAALSVFDYVSVLDVFLSKGCTKVLKKFKALKTYFVNQCFTMRKTGHCMNTKSSAKSEQRWLFHKRFSYVCLCLCSSECGRDSLGEMGCHVLICTNQNLVLWLVQSRWSSRLAHFWSVKVAIIFI